ncbi:MAG: 30S ribosomal protein S9 [Candidatus Yanofskybacteria bacterium GW2011_GWA2_44_9]|uniref:Small ribosomal subunit protein uS9 n=1 Tax=Candidatus Yanofskybacteria bacterium GW2011_GWA2_44_9 TaxID=1619025 RepID=A0A0G1KB46_9BACT|nr:MAG: 30S ribosomal protein S9 [Candidatus Yanofskybacteria bacterium GW2011_GWA2_44_9]
MPKKTTTTKNKKPAKKAKAKKAVAETKEIKIVEPAVEAEGVLDSEGKDKKEKYFQAVGRRKESVAITRLYTKKSTDIVEDDKALILVNGKDYRQYFTDQMLQLVVESPLRKLKSLNRFKATALVNGGGLAGQADALKHGLSRALVMFDLNFRKKLKKAGFLTRDSRTKERRKYGLKKARKAPQWQKR